MPAPRYPSKFPCPLIDGFGIDVDAGLIRSKEGGMPHQRRTFLTMPHSFKCRFFLSIKDWGYWQEWIQNDGRQWFTIDLPSMYAGLKQVQTTPHIVRLMSPLTIDARTHEYVTVSVVLELAPSMFKQMASAIVPSSRWVVARTPVSPSSPDWIIGQTPAAPSTDTMTAGTPMVPAA